MKRMRFLAVGSVAVALAFGASHANAVIIYKAGTGGNLDTLTSWYTTEAGLTNPASIGTSDTLRFGGTGQSGNVVGALLGSNMTVGAVRLDNITGTPNYTVSVAAGNTLTLNGNNDYNAGYLSGIILNSATGGSLTLDANIALAASQRWITSRTLAVGGDVDLGGNTLTVWDASATTTISGDISNGAIVHRYGTASGTLILSGNNSYSGGTTINSGIVRVSTNDSALGTGTVTFTGNATLATASGGGARNLANTVTVNSGVTASMDAGYADLTLGGAIGGAGNLAQTSSGKVILSTANGYTGTTYVNGAGGVMKVTGSGVLGGTSGSTTDAGNIVFGTSNSNNTLEFETSAQLGVADQVRFRNTGGTAGSGGNLKYVGTTAQTVSKTLQSDSSIGIRLESNSVGGSIKYNGSFSQTNRPLYLGGTGTGDNELAIVFAGSGSLTKRDAGTWIVSQNNTYSGATNVKGGTLLVNGNHTGGATYTVDSGAILGGTGSTDSDVIVNGIIAPGASIGTLGVGDTTINGNYLLEADTLGNSDLLNVTGLLTLGGSSVLDLDAGSSLDASTIYTIASYTTLSGTFNTVDSAIQLTHNVDYFTGNQIRLVPVPEPGSFALMLLSAIGLWMVGQKRRG